jgi:hypothetical protein
MPFYRQLVDRGKNPRVPLFVLSIDAEEDMKKLLSRESVHVEGVYRVPPTNGLPGTPMLLFVDSKGMVKRIFGGQLDSSRQREVLEILKTVSLVKG